MSDCDGCKETSENWQQHIEEIIALRAIYGDDFRLLKVDGSPENLFFENLDSDGFSAFNTSPSGAQLKGEVKIRVEVPDGEVSVRVNGGSESSTEVPIAVEVGKVQHLPPLSLCLTFHSEYPGSKPPGFVLSCMWLDSKQLGVLCTQLDCLWEAGGKGAPICFTWIDWIANSALEHLGITNTLDLQVGGQISYEDVDPRVGCEGGVTLDAIAGQLLRFNAHQRARVFRQGIWSCPICMEDTAGQLCVRLPGCQHYFCRICFLEYCKVNIQEGQVDLRCPQHQCDAVLEPHVLKTTLKQDDYDRWEALTLQRTLDKMRDVWYCPRCNMVCLEEAGHMSQCPKCFFVFCTVCFQSYHPGTTCMSVEMKLEEIRKTAEDLREESKEAQQHLFADFRQSTASRAFIESNMQKCPGCDMWVEHSGGCNKMVCVYCKSMFCYKCGKGIEGYSHFRDNSACKLFAQEVLEAWENEMHPVEDPRNHEAGNRQNAEGHVQGTRTICPSCRQLNFKTQRNNHIRCWACGSNYCYLCKLLIPRGGIGVHFTTTNCKQHSDD